MAVTVTSLELDLKVKVGDSTKSIDKLVSGLEKLQKCVNGLNLGGIQRLNHELERMYAALEGISISKAVLAIKNLPKAAGISSKDIAKVVEQVNEARSQGMGAISGESGEGDSGIGRAADEAKKATVNFKLANTALGKLWGSIKRIALYRLIRSVMRLITQSIREGILNLYEWSKVYDSTFKESFESLQDSALLIKNSIGAAFAPLINAAAPVVETLADKFAEMATTASKFFAVLSGQKWYYEAIRSTKQLAAAQRDLLGFDEINRLSGGKESGGGNFEKHALDEGEYSEIAKKLKEIETLAIAIGTAIGAWKLATFLTSLGSASKAVAGIATGLEWVAKFAALGIIVGVTYKLVEGTSESFLGEGGDLHDAIAETASRALGAGLGYAVMGKTGLAITVFTSLIASYKNMYNSAKKGELEVFGAKEAIETSLDAAFAGIAGYMFGGWTGGLAAAFMAIAISAGVTAMAMKKSGSFQENSDMYYLKVLQSMFSGGLAAAMLGMKVGSAVTGTMIGGLAGAGIGLVIGLTITLLVMDILLDPNGKGINKGVEQFAGTNMAVIQDDYWAFEMAIAKEKAQELQDAGTLEDFALEEAKKRVHTKRFAYGGTPARGSLFLAGEAGAELVSSVNGHTTVTNQTQFEDIIVNANGNVVSAVMAMGNAIVTAINSQDNGLYIDGERVTRLFDSKMQSLNHYNGTSLVKGAY